MQLAAAATELTAAIARAWEKAATTQRISHEHARRSRRSAPLARGAAGRRARGDEGTTRVSSHAAALRELRASSAEAARRAKEVREGDLALAVGAATRRAEKREAAG